jgi:glycosyltransferase involved in cell wall biosynthesis
MGVVISTFNHPAWLEKTLWGYLNQQFDRCPVELIIADDGSKEETRNLIDRYRSEFAWEIKHVWHPDNGFRKCEILNRAIWETSADYLIFTDQDCIPYPHNLETHYRYAQRCWFVSGGYLKLPLDVSQQIARDDIERGTIFTPQWLKRHCFSTREKVFWSFTMLPPPLKDWLTTTSATWNGSGSSCWRDDALLVNGFNEAMRYGGLDREFGERLMNAGIRAKQCRYSLTYLHLDHARPYEDREVWEQNRAIRQQVRKERIVQTPQGIQQHRAQSEPQS